jgi:hypothetical protein
MSVDASAGTTASSGSGMGVREGIGYTVATVVSYVVNPLVLPPILLGLVLWHAGAPTVQVWQGTALGLVFFAVVPLLFVGWMRMRGEIATLEIRDRAKRFRPFAVGFVSGCAAYAAILAADLVSGDLVAAIVACHVLNTVLLALITLRWKISIHCTALAGVVGVLWFARVHVSGEMLASPVLGRLLLGGSLLLLPLLAWARVRSGAHTPAQATAGTLFGLTAPYLELLALQGMGLL